MSDRIERIKQKLRDALAPVELEVIDESHKHAGHAGAKGGGGHYIVKIVSPAFEGKSLIQKHRMVYEAVGDMMKSEIHALSIVANTPSED